MAIRMNLLVVYAALCLLSLYNANAFIPTRWLKSHRIVGISWSDCGPASDPAHINSLTVTPDPVKIPGNITINTAFTLSTASPSDITLTIDMKKKVGPAYIKIPCVDDIGSCTYGDVCKDWAEACPKYFSQFGIPCACPIPPNTYTVAGATVDVSTKLPPGSTGDFKIQADLNSATAGHLFCLSIEVNVASL